MNKNKYLFGFEAELVGDNSLVADFKIDYDPQAENYNPYSKERISQVPLNTTKTERITSIPSPYARMHVTDLAFMELRDGRTLFSKKKNVGANDISPDYSRALSHCLDVFEMLFHSDEIDLQEKGITVKKIELERPQIEYNEKLNNYLETLQLYRNQYMRTIKRRMKGNLQDGEYLFDFSTLYVLKHKGKTFAAASPFTGFFTKADCNLSDADLYIKDAQDCQRKLFTDNPADWRDMKGRSLDFRKFMYLLLNEHGTKLRYIYENLFAVVEQSLTPAELNALNNTIFSNQPEYRKFNIGNQELQEIGTYKNQTLYIRPDNIDCSYLKYLLYQVRPADLSISKEEYDKKVENRTFDGEVTYWLGPNDILSDALFVLPYDINDNYLSISFFDESVDKQTKNRCLIPIKSSGLQHLTSLLGDLSKVREKISIVRKSKEVFLVKMKIDLVNGGTSVIRREYKTNEANYPKGKVVAGDAMKPFAFGIYPFVKTTIFDNIYKVLFYHHELTPISIEKEKEGSKVIQTIPLLNFFHINQTDNGIRNLCEFSHEGTEASVKCNGTVKKNDKLPGNSLYYHIEADRNGLDVIEVTSTEGSSLIVPKLRRVEEEQGEGIIQMKQDEVIISVDLGTSNTYASYMTRESGDGDFGPIQEISTIHVDGKNKEWSELMFMHGRCDATNAISENRSDLYLKDENGNFSDKWLATQLCEFVPSRIVPQNREDKKNKNDGYSFPIPSVINQTYVNGTAPSGEEEKIPLFNSAIPFAYYKIGKREGAYDRITDGKFKWLRNKDSNGDYVTNKPRERAFRSFVKELLFLFRSNLICLGYHPSKTTLIWTYPLSFAEELREEHEGIWNEEFQKCFNGGKILFTNESMAPIYECIKNLNNVARLTLLIDVVGGSTDVFGFKSNTPVFSSSFGFAGNSLYLDGDLNHDESINKEINVMRKQIEKDKCKEALERKSELAGTIKINKKESISSIMNYGFSQAPDAFEKVFKQNKDPKYLLRFHNAALLYHIAQLCNIMSPDECPVEIYLTGNGSKLLMLNNEYKDFIKKIFKYFYGDAYDEEDFKIKTLDNPKTATSLGALKGYKNSLTGNPGLAFGVENDIAQVVMLGDKTTKYKVAPGHNSVTVTIDDEKKTAVENNVTQFVDFFYENLWDEAEQTFKKANVIKYIQIAGKDDKMKFKKTLSESIFFQYISLIMENISAKMIE